MVKSGDYYNDNFGNRVYLNEQSRNHVIPQNATIYHDSKEKLPVLSSIGALVWIGGISIMSYFSPIPGNMAQLSVPYQPIHLEAHAEKQITGRRDDLVTPESKLELLF